MNILERFNLNGYVDDVPGNEGTEVVNTREPIVAQKPEGQAEIQECHLGIQIIKSVVVFAAGFFLYAEIIRTQYQNFTSRCKMRKYIQRVSKTTITPKFTCFMARMNK